MAERTPRGVARRGRGGRDGRITGFKTAAAEEIPAAVAVMDPFHVVRLAGDALDKCRRRVQLAIHGHRDHKDDPLYVARRTLHTGADLLTDKQKDRLPALFAAEEHVEVEATWGIYQRMIVAYRHPDRTKGRELMQNLIGSVSAGVPAALSEVITLGRTPEEARRRRAGLLRQTRHQQRPNRGDQRTTRTPPRLRRPFDVNGITCEWRRERITDLQPDGVNYFHWDCYAAVPVAAPKYPAMRMP